MFDTVLSNIRWKYKIIGLSGFFVILIGVVALFAYRTLGEVNDGLNAEVQASQQRASAALIAGGSIVELDRAINALISASETTEIKQGAIAAIRAAAVLDENVQRLQSLLGESAAADELAATLAALRPVQMQIIKAGKKNEDAVAIEASKRIFNDTNRARELANVLVEDEYDLLNERFGAVLTQNRDRMQRTNYYTLIGGAFGLLLSYLITCNLCDRLRRSVSAAQQIGSGDLSVEIAARGRDEVALLDRALQGMRENLERLMTAEREQARTNQEQAEKLRAEFEKNERQAQDLRAEFEKNERQTEELRAQAEAMRAQEAETLQARVALENVASAVLLLNPDGSLAYVNPAMRDAFEGISRHTCVAVPTGGEGRGWSSVLGDRQGRWTALLAQLGHAREAEDEFTFGEQNYVVTAKTVTDDNGTHLGVTAEWRDVSAQREAEMRVINSVSAVADGILQHSNALSKDNQDLSASSVRLAGLMQEAVGSVHEIDRLIDSGAELSNSSISDMQKLTDAAEAGTVHIGSAIEQMAKINADTTRISDISNTIDELAFQTNLLALNAAVEAARAGEQGRGFAVVAQEVRRLATRCAEASRDIAGLISTTLETTSQGKRHIDESGKVMAGVAEAVTAVANALSNIQVVSSEQAGLIKSINTAINEVKEYSDANAGRAEVVTDGSRALERLAYDLRDSIESLKTATDDDDAPAAPIISLAAG